jgi:hypothetical protein
VSASNANLTLAGVVTIDQATNTVCLTSASSGMCPVITLGSGFTASNPQITLDLASTQAAWVPGWVGQTILKLGSGGTIGNLKNPFILRNFYTSSGNKPFDPNSSPIAPHFINNNGVLQ